MGVWSFDALVQITVSLCKMVRNINFLTWALLLISKVYCHPIEEVAHVKVRADQLDSTYDYVIVGGGTSGLTIADRLTEDGTSKKL